MILLSSCAQRAQEAKGHQTVKIDTVVSADKQTFLQFPGKVKAAQAIHCVHTADTTAPGLTAPTQYSQEKPRLKRNSKGN